MTVAATLRRAGPYLGNDVTTTFPFGFKVFKADDLQVVYTDASGVPTNLVLNSDYSVVLNANQDANPGGTVTYPLVNPGPVPPLPTGTTLTMVGDLAYAQPTDITNTGRFLPQVFENALDRVTILTQQLAEISSRTLQAAIGTTVSLIFPAPSSGKFIRWRTDLLGLENAEAGTDSMVLQGLLADGTDPSHGSAMSGYLPFGPGAAPDTVQGKLRKIVHATDFPGSTISRKIQNAFNSLVAASHIPFTIHVPQPPAGGVWDWDTVVDLSADSWVTLEGDGIVAVRATGAITSFVRLGIANKNNEARVAGFSFDCFNQNVNEAVLTGSIRGVEVERIELKRTGTGSFIDGVRIAGDLAHTGSEPGAGNEMSHFHHIHDSGDSSVSRSMVYFQGGTSLGVKVHNIRATRDRWTTVVGSDNTSGFNGCEIFDIEATFLAVRAIKAAAMVNLQRAVIATKVRNLFLTGVPGNQVNYGLLVNNLTAVVSGALHTENLGIQYIIKDVLVPTTVLRTHVNGVSYNAGNPNTNGPISSNTAFAESGGLIYDTTNKTVWVGGESSSAGMAAYRTPVMRRVSPIADDGVLQIQLPSDDHRLGGGLISVACDLSAGTVYEGMVSARLTGTSVCRKLTGESTNLAVTTGALTGTTGLDGDVTVSANAANNSLYVENRSGAARTFVITWLT